MSGTQDQTRRVDPSFRPLMRSLAIELSIYGPIVTIYFFVALRYAKEPLLRLYHENPPLYATVGTFLIVVQGVLLEFFTSWLLRRIGLR